MIDDLSAQFRHALADIRIKQEIHMENLLILAARSGCGIDMTTAWVRTDTGYALESEVTLAPDLPPYAVRDGKHLYQYALRKEGDDT